MAKRRWAALVAASVLGVACADLLGIDGVDYAPVEDASFAPDAAPNRDSPEAPDAEAVGYGSLTDPSRWSTFDTTKASQSIGPFYGGAFDGGHYVYFVPFVGTQRKCAVLRYDTLKPFSDYESWTESIDLRRLISDNTCGFAGAVVAQDALYLAPIPTQTSPRFVRFDTASGGFSMASGGQGWETFDFANLVPDAASARFAGAIVSGGGIQFVPYAGGIVARYDTAQKFTSPLAWSTFDPTPTLGVVPVSLHGGTAAAGYVYFPGFSGGRILRHAEGQPFDGGWASVDVPSVVSVPQPTSYTGAVFDGKKVTFVPRQTHALQLDPAATNWMGTGPWSTFDMAALSDGGLVAYIGGTFDGRYTYFAPFVFADLSPAGRVARFDTEGSFADAGSWQTFDLAQDGGPAEFAGAVFDGEYVYFVPNLGTVVARFRARTGRVKAPATTSSL